jgi:hypothetical protein
MSASHSLDFQKTSQLETTLNNPANQTCHGLNSAVLALSLTPRLLLSSYQASRSAGFAEFLLLATKPFPRFGAASAPSLDCDFGIP